MAYTEAINILQNLGAIAKSIRIIVKQQSFLMILFFFRALMVMKKFRLGLVKTNQGVRIGVLQLVIEHGDGLSALTSNLYFEG